MSEGGNNRSSQEQHFRPRPGYPADHPLAYNHHCWDCNRLGHYANSPECYVQRASGHAVIFNIDNNSTLQTRPHAEMRFPASSRDRSRSPVRAHSNLRARSPLCARSSQRDTHNSNDSWGGSYYSDPTQWDHSHFTGGRSDSNEHRTSSDPRRDRRNGQRSQATTSTAELSSAIRSSVDEWEYNAGGDRSNGGNEHSDNW
ncbi:uncharacterized protein N7473_000226 [Penicillium subrubescens]|uniref:uncharacterized protein n=1 Tax=Penicillium subrubescens TaxID=1316194 RepID=UPI0025450164|nr:uncharacterized protein N7473_000226 [Penicillium subrubescens]KAJ5910923.1 hypothetical protein N7473_000226 [Penicillium subrubescens]